MKRAILLAAALLGSACSDESSLRILEFAANPVTVARGGTTVLQYRAEGADTVLIAVLQDGGALILPPTGQLAGMVTTPPIEATTTFILTAKKGSEETSRTLTVRLREGGGEAVILTFTANPATVDAGGGTTLSWTTDKATRGAIRTGGTELTAIAAESLAQGMFTVASVTAPTVFTLAVAGADGVETTADVTVILSGGGPMIARFDAAPNPIIRGDSTTLEWNVIDAERISINGNLTGSVYLGGELVSSLVLSPRFTELYTLLAFDADNRMAIATVEVRVNAPPGADILEFTATPSSVMSGEEVTLAWRVANAPDGIVLQEGQTVLTTTIAQTGTFVVQPFDNTTYTLRALNRMRGDAQRDVTVTVTFSPGARIRSFRATPNLVMLGEGVALSWEVENADGIEITDALGAVLTATTSAEGEITVFPETSTQFHLTAFNPALGDATAQIMVTVTQGPPSIISFFATPEEAAFSSAVELSWQVVGASSVRVLAGIEEIYSGTERAATIDAPVGLEDTVFTLEVMNTGGAVVTATDTVSVFGLPDINFDIAPRYSPNATANVNLAWTVDDTTHVELFIDGVPRVVGPLPQRRATIGFIPGSTQIMFTRSAVLELVAHNVAGSSLVRREIAFLTTETEPNDSLATALPLAGDGSGYNSAINPALDVDWYSVQVPQGASLRVETSDAMLSCAIDTVVELYNPAGVLIESDDDSAFQVFNVAGCSLIDPRFDTWAQNLAAGTYYLRVINHPLVEFLTTTTGPYAIVARVIPAACGDGIVQGTEQCDDGTPTGGDGCTPQCTREDLRRFFGPGTRWLMPGTLDYVTLPDRYRLELDAPSYVRAELFSPLPVECRGADTVLRLFDGALVELASDDDGGILSCSMIDTSIGPAVALQAGTYYLTIEDSGLDDIIDYTLALDLIPVGCGNHVLEPAEGCDDGNVLAGDGCSATCTFEGFEESELLGNNTAGGSGVLSAAVSTTFRGALAAAGDEDWYALTVPAGHHLDAWLSTGGIDNCPSTGPSARLALFDDSLRQLAIDDSGGPNITCGRISPATTDAAFSMAAGTYYLRADESGDDQTISQYYLHARIIAPACGNGFVEGGEQCDDGNTSGGDGCAGGCAYELHPRTIVAPGGTVAILFPGPGTSIAVRVDTAAGGQAIEAITGENAGMACNRVDTGLELRDASFQLLGGSSTGGAAGPSGTCAAIFAPEDAFTTNLPAGAHYLIVRDEGGSGGSTELAVTIQPSSCGNGLLETNAFEECDDDNNAGGDGCDAACRFEPLGLVNAPSASPQVFAGSLSTAGERDAYRITVAAGTIYLFAETFAPNVASGCAGADTVLRLYGVSSAELGSDDDGGAGACSRIDGGNAFARLGPGIYHLVVEDFMNDDPLAAYEVRIQGRPVNTCGNGVRENAEACDDGNTAAGDGCSGACAWEAAPPIPEVEPNDGPGAASQALGPLALGAIVNIAASIDEATDEDWFSFTIAGTEHASALITTHGQFGVLASCGFDTQMWLYHAQPADLLAQNALVEPAITAYDNNDGFGLCAQLAGTDAVPIPVDLAPGTYYLRVQSFHHATPIPGYFVRFDLR